MEILEHPAPVDVLLVGFGAVGVVYAYMLERSGLARVTAVARSNYASIQEKGIKITTDEDKFGIIQGYRPHRLVSSIDEAADTTYAYVVITTKSLPDVSPTEELVKPIIKKRLSETFVLIQNGLGIEEGLFAATRGIDATILTSVAYICTNLNSGRDEVIFEGKERLEIGIYHPPPPSLSSSSHRSIPKPTPKQSQSLQRFVEILNKGEAITKVEQDMELTRFKKNCWNCCWASMACLSRLGMSHLIEELDVLGPSLLELCQEVEQIGLAAHLLLPPDFGEMIYNTTIAFRRASPKAHKPSALVDVLDSRPFEVEVTVGNVLRMGRRVGVDEGKIARLRLVYGLLRVVQGGLTVRRGMEIA